jgi:hypothetical protein
MAGPIKAARTKKGYDELKALTGAAPPASLNQLSADDLAHLTGVVGAALERHEAAIAEAEHNLVQMAPRPLRGTVRRVLGVGG